MALSELKNYFTLNDRQRLILSDDAQIKGGFANYLPGSGSVTVESDVYRPYHGSTPFLEYIFASFGRPDIQFHTTGSPETKQTFNPRIIASHFTSDVVERANQLGMKVGKVYDLINNKEFFQYLVQSSLGNASSTNPRLVPKGSSLDDIDHAASMVIKPGDKQLVLRIPDTSIAPGGGMGVRFIKNTSEIRPALESMQAAAMDHTQTAIVANERLTTRLMIERYIPHTASPSTTFFLGESGVEPLTINSQILNEGQFVAGTNILPKGIGKFIPELQSKGTSLAQRAFRLGARGFMGIDWVVGEQGSVAVEANYRETGNTIPEVQAQRANNFIDGSNWANWIFLLSIPYNDRVRSFTDALDSLRKQHALFEGAQDRVGFDTPRFIPLYGLQTEDFDAVIIWNKSVSNEKSFARINTVLENLGSLRRLHIPRLKEQ